MFTPNDRVSCGVLEGLLMVYIFAALVVTVHTLLICTH